MTPERLQRVKKIFDHALRCEPQRRAEYLADACAGDPQIRGEVESLLSAHEAAGTSIEEPTLNTSAVAQLAQKKSAEAQASLNQALALIRSSERRYLSLSVDLTEARVRAALGKTPEAQRLLARVLDSATRAGYPALQLEARLAAGEMSVHSSNASLALKELAALQREAAARGFGLIARKASGLASAHP
jgi:hypothetical protein